MKVNTYLSIVSAINFQFSKHFNLSRELPKWEEWKERESEEHQLARVTYKDEEVHIQQYLEKINWLDPLSLLCRGYFREVITDLQNNFIGDQARLKMLIMVFNKFKFRFLQRHASLK